MELELISFKLCPFVQRSVITLLHKKVPYTLTHIDPTDPPHWFLEISPFEKVPVLRVGESVLFESAVINEYIDDVTPGRLHPEDPLQRALNRSWIEFGSACIMDNVAVISASTEQKLEQRLEELQEKLDRLETVVGDGPYFNGSALALIDAAYAPLFMRFDMLRDAVDVCPRERYPRVNAWAGNLLDLDVVRKSVVPDLKIIYRNMVRERRGCVASFIKD